MPKEKIKKACMVCGAAEKPLKLIACKKEDGAVVGGVFICCSLPEDSTLMVAPKVFSLSKKEMAAKLETARLVLAAVAEKANVSTEQLLELLEKTEAEIRLLED